MHDDSARTPDASALPLTAAPAEAFGGLASLDRRAWYAVGGIGMAGAALTTTLARGWHQAPALGQMLAIMALVVAVRAVWRVLRGGVRRHARNRAHQMIVDFGGGSYGTVAMSVFLYLEALALTQDWSRATGVWDFVQNRSVQWLMGFSVDSILNVVWAGMWPVYLLREHGMMVAGIAWGILWCIEEARKRLAGPAQVDAELAPARG